MPGDVRELGFVICVGRGASISEVAAEYEVSEESVRDAVEWAAVNPGVVRQVIEERSESLAELDVEYPNGVESPREADAAVYRERQLEALESVVRRFS